jgi:hypothetical protein
MCYTVAAFDYPSVIKVTFGRMADEISDYAWDVLNGSGMGQGSESLGRFVRMTRVGDLGLGQLHGLFVVL